MSRITMNLRIFRVLTFSFRIERRVTSQVRRQTDRSTVHRTKSVA
jgi:hypothetical protein